MKIMGKIATSNRQITLFYSSNSEKAKQTLAFAMTEGLPILEIDVLKTKLTGTQIVELAHRLHIKVADLINKEHATYKTDLNANEFSTNDWIKMIQNNPKIMKQPIALRGETTILVKTPTDILKI
jgi:arsenate reductase